MLVRWWRWALTLRGFARPVTALMR